MARPLWSGAISFGLLNIPVQLMPGERRTELHFHMLDGRDKARVHYQRVNEDTGKEVPWKNVVKAFEYKKGSYVVLNKDDPSSIRPRSIPLILTVPTTWFRKRRPKKATYCYARRCAK
jgi:DNA end-binding protein Ku